MPFNAEPDFKPITQVLLKRCMPNATDDNIQKYTMPLNNAMQRYEINTARREAAFIAQMAHECQSLSVMVENLNYSATGLMKTFPRYFTDIEQAKKYERNPEMIANYVYGNRMGNIEPGDGWKFRGRGPFMITGKDNYEALSHALNYDFVKDPDSLLKPGASMLSAAWFWNMRELNRLADIDAFEKITRKINGGLIGIEDRKMHWENCRLALRVEI